MAESEQDPLEYFFRTVNPNPQRIGCPTQEVLQLVARRKVDVPKGVFLHLAKCSECSVDVKAYRLRFQRRASRRNLLLAGALVTVGFAGVALLVVPQTSRFHVGFIKSRPTQTQDVAINLWERDPLRGGSQASKTIRVPPTSVRLIITLPRFSRSGPYRISFCRERTDDSAFIRARASAVSKGPLEIVTVVLNLANVEKGSYWLSTRYDEDAASDYFPVKVL